MDTANQTEVKENAKTKLILFSIIGILAILIIFFLVFSKVSFSPQTNLETCNILNENQGSKFNIVFFAEKQEAEKYSGLLLNTSPFNQNKQAFNFYYIDSWKPACEIYKNIALLCYSKELIKKSSSCQNDYIIVLEDKPGNIRSSSYMNVLSINTNNPEKVLIHEFGHAFANLADEYTPAKIPRGSKNCVLECSEFPDNDGICFGGCSKPNYLRSINLGLMRTLNSDTYGAFNENLILSKIAETPGKKLTAMAISEDKACTSQEYYLIEGRYLNEKINIFNKSLETGCVGKNGAGGFDYRITGQDNSVIQQNEFNPELIFTDTQNAEIISGETYESSINFILKIPVISNAEKLSILIENKTLAETSLKDIGAIPCKI